MRSSRIQGSRASTKCIEHCPITIASYTTFSCKHQENDIRIKFNARRFVSWSPLAHPRRVSESARSNRSASRADHDLDTVTQRWCRGPQPGANPGRSPAPATRGQRSPGPSQLPCGADRSLFAPRTVAIPHGASRQFAHRKRVVRSLAPMWPAPQAPRALALSDTEDRRSRASGRRSPGSSWKELCERLRVRFEGLDLR